MWSHQSLSTEAFQFQHVPLLFVKFLVSETYDCPLHLSAQGQMHLCIKCVTRTENWWIIADPAKWSQYPTYKQNQRFKGEHQDSVYLSNIKGDILRILNPTGYTNETLLNWIRINMYMYMIYRVNFPSFNLQNKLPMVKGWRKVEVFKICLMASTVAAQGEKQSSLIWNPMNATSFFPNTNLVGFLLIPWADVRTRNSTTW